MRPLLFILFPLIAYSQHVNLLKKGDLYYSKSVYDSAAVYYTNGIKNCNHCDQLTIANYYLKLGKANKLIEKKTTALQNFYQAEKIFNALQNYDGLFASKVHIAEFYRAIGDEEKSFILIEEAKQFIEKYTITKKNLAYYYNRRAAIISQAFNDKEKAIELSKKAIAISEEIGAYQLMIYSHNELAYAYELKDKKRLSIHHYHKALDIARKHNLGIETCDILYNLGREKSLRIEYGLPPPQNQNPAAYKEAVSYFKEGLALATKINYLEKQKDFSKQLFHYYERTHQYKKAIVYNQHYRDYEIQMIEKRSKGEIAEVEAKYLDEKKDNQIQLNQNKIRTQYILLFCFIILLLVLLVFFIKSRIDKTNIQHQKGKIEEILSQKIVLLKEIHHRVKNNLHLTSSLLYLQSVKHKSKEVQNVINESLQHINSIALVHEMLYKNETYSVIFMKKYIQELSEHLLQISPEKKITTELHIKDITLPMDYATTIGLILNELITNSLKYAFETQKGTITISLTTLNTEVYQLTYSDNGKGLESNLTNTSSQTLGQRLIKMLAEEIEADLTIANGKGLTYIFNFKNKYVEKNKSD